MGTAKKHVPALRFPEFTELWKTDSVDSFVRRVSNPVTVEPDCMYRQIGVRSHGKGIFHKEPVTGKSLGEKRVFWVHSPAFVVNIVFGWEQAVALTSDAEEGFIASHRFPMFVPVGKKTDLDFLLLFFLRKRGKYLLELASPGGAGRNKTLGQNEFAKLDVTLPALPEQQKIACFIEVVGEKIKALRRRRELLQSHKRGMMQKIFSREVRFKGDDGAEFPEWKKLKLGDVASTFSGGTPASLNPIYYGKGYPFIKSGEIGVAVTEQHITAAGLKNSSAKLIKKGDLLYALYGATSGEIAISKIDGAINQAVLCIRTNQNKEFLYQYLRFEKEQIKAIYLQGGQGNLSAEIIKSLKVNIPTLIEQQKIADFLSAIDAKIDAVAGQIEKMEQFKKGLLQRMFV